MTTMRMPMWPVSFVRLDYSSSYYRRSGPAAPRSSPPPSPASSLFSRDCLPLSANPVLDACPVPYVHARCVESQALTRVDLTSLPCLGNRYPTDCAAWLSQVVPDRHPHRIREQRA